VRFEPPGTDESEYPRRTSTFLNDDRFEDWMVETEGIELPTRHPVSSRSLDIRGKNGIFDAETGGRNGLIAQMRDHERLYRDTSLE
jgi:hypothetical protein